MLSASVCLFCYSANVLTAFMMFGRLASCQCSHGIHDVWTFGQQY